MILLPIRIIGRLAATVALFIALTSVAHHVPWGDVSRASHILYSQITDAVNHARGPAKVVSRCAGQYKDVALKKTHTVSLNCRPH